MPHPTLLPSWCLHILSLFRVYSMDRLFSHRYHSQLAHFSLVLKSLPLLPASTPRLLLRDLLNLQVPLLLRLITSHTHLLSPSLPSLHLHSQTPVVSCLAHGNILHLTVSLSSCVFLSFNQFCIPWPHKADHLSPLH